jgi:hypothetical protein
MRVIAAVMRLVMVNLGEKMLKSNSVPDTFILFNRRIGTKQNRLFTVPDHRVVAELALAFQLYG